MKVYIFYGNDDNLGLINLSWFHIFYFLILYNFISIFSILYIFLFYGSFMKNYIFSLRFIFHFCIFTFPHLYIMDFMMFVIIVTSMYLNFYVEIIFLNITIEKIIFFLLLFCKIKILLLKVRPFL